MGEVPEREDGPSDAGSERGPEVDDREFGERDNGGGGEPHAVAKRGQRLPPLEREALVEILEFVAKSLVADPDAVAVEFVDREGGVTLRLTVHQADMGKIIGRAGRTARAIRVLMRAAGTRVGVNTHVEIVEEAGGSGE